MRVNRSHLRVLLAVHDATTYQELAAVLDISTSYANTIVTDLVEQGLLEKERNGKTVTITPSDSKAVELLHRLDNQYSHIDWDKLLAGKALEVLFYLDRPRTLSDLAERSENYRNTVYRILDRFQQRGIITKTDKHYAVPDEFSVVVDLAHEYVHHSHRNTVRDVSPQATILWEDTHAFLIQTTDTIDEPTYHPTGPAVFERFDLPLLTTADNHYIHTDHDKEPDAEAVLCHTLLIDNTPRYRSYCLLLIAQEDLDPEAVTTTAERYGLKDTIKALLTYLNSEGTKATAGQPDWDELEQLADEYGVRL